MARLLLKCKFWINPFKPRNNPINIVFMSVILYRKELTILVYNYTKLYSNSVVDPLPQSKFHIICIEKIFMTQKNICQEQCQN